MTSSPIRVCFRLWPAVTAVAIILAFAAAGLARAEDNGAGTNGDSTGLAGIGSKIVGTAPASPVDEFSKQLEDFQKSVPDLNKAIQDSASAIDGVTDIDKARVEIDQLRQEISTLLAAVSDNGPVSQLGVKALDHVHAKLKLLSQETRFKPEERQFLIDQWQQIAAQTETANKELGDARAQFAGLLQTLQSNEDFIDELVEIRQAQKAIDVMRSLTKNIRDASSQLNKLIGAIKPPGV
jgi:DNA repair exonuclease SbcCD ATPase subunit